MTAEFTTAAELKRLTRKELAQQARRGRISGWHGMKKDELVRALSKQARNERRRAKNRPQTESSPADAPNGNRKRNGHTPNSTARPIGKSGNGVGRTRDLSSSLRKPTQTEADFVHAEAEDAYWIHVNWSFSRAMVARAEAALGIDWHRAVPVIRLFDVAAGEGEGPDYRRQVCDIEIHGDVDHWHVPVDRPDRTCQLHIGYRSPTGRFHALGKSRVVHMPKPGANGAIDRTWKRDTKRAREYDHQSNSNGHKNNGKSRSNGRASNGHTNGEHDFPFRVDAELIVHGETHPQAKLTLLGEPVKLSKDGRFSLRFALPNGRQVIPAVTVTPSGKEQQTIVLAIERITRELAPQRTDDLL